MKRYEPGPLSGSLSESPMPIRSGAMQRPRGCKCGSTLRQRYDEVGLPCSSTIGSPSPTSTYDISLPRTCRRFFWYGNFAEIMLPFPPFFVIARKTEPEHSLYVDRVKSSVFSLVGMPPDEYSGGTSFRRRETTISVLRLARSLPSLHLLPACLLIAKQGSCIIA